MDSNEKQLENGQQDLSRYFEIIPSYRRKLTKNFRNKFVTFNVCGNIDVCSVWMEITTGGTSYRALQVVKVNR